MIYSNVGETQALSMCAEILSHRALILAVVVAERITGAFVVRPHLCSLQCMVFCEDRKSLCKSAPMC